MDPIGLIFLIVVVVRVFLPYIIYLLVVGFIYIKFIKPRVKSIVKRRFIVTGLILLFFIEPIITNLVAGFYILTMPRAENIKVDYPISVYDKTNRRKLDKNKNPEIYDKFPLVYLDGIYTNERAVPTNGKVYVMSCNYDSKKGLKEFKKECTNSEKIYTEKTMPQMDYVIDDNIASKFFVTLYDHKITDKYGNIIYIERRIYRNFDYLLSLNFSLIAGNLKVLYDVENGTQLKYIINEKDMDKARLEQPKVKEFTNLN